MFNAVAALLAIVLLLPLVAEAAGAAVPFLLSALFLLVLVKLALPPRGKR